MQQISYDLSFQCLALILGRSSQEEDGNMKVESGCSEFLNSYQWLYEGLTSLSHFEAIKMQIFMYIRAVGYRFCFCFFIFKNKMQLI